MSISLEQRIQRLEDIQAITALKARYVNLNDGGWKGPTHQYPQEVADLFVADGSWDGRPSAGYARGHAEIKELFTAFQSVKFILHYITNPMIEVDGDTASGHWHALVTMTAHDDQAYWSLGLYIDTFVRTAEGWKLKDLRFEPASVSPYEAGWGKQRMAVTEFES